MQEEGYNCFIVVQRAYGIRHVDVVVMEIRNPADHI